MSVLSKIVIGGIAFMAGALIAAKEDGNNSKPDGGCKCHNNHQNQQPPIQPNPYTPPQAYSQPINGMMAPIQPTHRIPIQVNDKDKKVDIGQLNVYGGDKLFNDALINLPQFKDLPLLPEQIKKLLGNVYVRKAVLALLERNGIDSSKFRFDEDTGKGVNQRPQNDHVFSFAGCSSTFNSHNGQVSATPSEQGNTAPQSSKPVEQDLGMDQATSSNADTVEHRAHSTISISSGSEELRIDPNAQIPWTAEDDKPIKKGEQ